MNFEISIQNYRNHIIILLLLVFIFSILLTENFVLIIMYVRTNNYVKKIIFY